MDASRPGAPAQTPVAGRRAAVGIATALAAFLLWGFAPVYFKAIDHLTALEILAHRVVWTLVILIVLVAALGRLHEVVLSLVSRRRLGILLITTVLVSSNWLIFIWAIQQDRLLEASLGYFINPLVTVLLGVVVLRERLRPLQWTALGIGAVAVAVLTWDYGRPPWIALTLAVSFGFYGLVKNRMGVRTGPITGLTTETLVLAPFALAAIAWFGSTGESTFLLDAPRQGLLLASTGIATVIPLLFFASAAQRIPLSTIGLLQYLAPVLQLLVGITFLGESLTGMRLVGFVIVWAALVVLTFDSVRNAQQRRADRRALQGAATPAPAPAASGSDG